MELQQSPQTKNFIREVERLISSGVVAKKQEIVDALEWNKSGMSSVFNKRINVPGEVYKKFREIYLTETEQGPPPDIKKSGEPDYRDEIIKLLKEQNGQLKEQVGNLREKLNLSLGEVRHNILLTRAIAETNQALLIELVAKQRKSSVPEVEPTVGKVNDENYRKAKEENKVFL